MGVNVDDSIDKAKLELKEYIDEKLQDAQDSQKKKLLDIESSIRKLGQGDKSPSAVGRGRGRLGGKDGR